MFRHLRALDGYESKEDLYDSLSPCDPENIKRIQKAGEGMGKSGSFFFFSHDDELLIKTMTLDDFNAFMKLFKNYFHYINIYPDSMIARIYGIYSVTLEGQDPVYLILMGNTKKIPDHCVRRIYDLKGSLVQREVKGKESSFKNTACLKDINILNLQDQEVILKFDKETQIKVMKQMSSDVRLLNRFGLMDYSLLFVIAFNPNYVKKFPEQFEQENGVLVKPYKLVKKEKFENAKLKEKRFKQKYTRLTQEFIQKMSGYTKEEFEERENQIRELGHDPMFNFDNMRFSETPVTFLNT